MRRIEPTAAHRAFRDDVIEVLRKHGSTLSAMELLALTAHLTGQIIALQDRRTMSPEAAMNIAGGDRELRTALVESAFVLLTVTKRNSALKAWGIKLAKRRGIQKAAIAVARRMSAILHRMWIDQTDFRWSEQPPQLEAA